MVAVVVSSNLRPPVLLCTTVHLMQAHAGPCRAMPNHAPLAPPYHTMTRPERQASARFGRAWHRLSWSHRGMDGSLSQYRGADLLPVRKELSSRPARLGLVVSAAVAAAAASFFCHPGHSARGRGPVGAWLPATFPPACRGMPPPRRPHPTKNKRTGKLAPQGTVGMGRQRRGYAGGGSVWDGKRN